MSEATPSGLSRNPFGPLRQDPWTRALWAVTIIGVALRFWRLGAWSFAGDEGFTMQFSTTYFSWSDVRPLAFAFNHYVTIPLLGLTELALRLGPALAGIASIPVFAWAVSRVYGRQAGFFTALTIALSPVLLLHSQLARYYMQSFLVAGFVPFAVRFWIGGCGARWLWIGIACVATGWFLVPSSAFILPGVLAWLALNFKDVGGARLVSWMRRRLVLMGGGVVAVLAAGLFLVTQVLGYESGMGHGWYSLGGIMLAAVSGVTVPISFTAFAGLVIVWRDRQIGRLDRTLLPVVAAGAALSFPVAYPFVMMSEFHVVSVLAVGYASAGIALARIWSGVRDRLVAASAVSVILLATAPHVVSYYADGSRLDWRAAAQRLRELHRLDPGPVFSNEHVIVHFYAPELKAHEVDWLSGRTPAWLDDPQRSSPVWLMLAETRKGIYWLRVNPAGVAVVDRCRLRDRITHERYDYQLFAVRIYECGPPAASGASAPPKVSANPQELGSLVKSRRGATALWAAGALRE